MDVRVRFWGTRGSIPTPGPRTVRHGGNTSCVEVSCDGRLFICDTGTGIRELGEDLLRRDGRKPVEADILVTHTHWDHIQGFPFFMPAYLPDTRLRIHSVKSVGESFEAIFRRQMTLNYFPVEIGDMRADIRFVHVSQAFEAGGVAVRTSYTNHPGVCAGFRLEFGAGRDVVYLTDHENHRAFSGDNELTRREDKAIEDFCRGAGLLICDSQYTDEDYKAKRGWGHSRWRDSLELGLAAGVRRLALFHHDPARGDEELEGIAQECRRAAADAGGGLECFAAKEGQEVAL